DTEATCGATGAAGLAAAGAAAAGPGRHGYRTAAYKSLFDAGPRGHQFLRVAVHIEQTKRIGLLEPDRLRGAAVFGGEPAEVVDQLLIITEKPGSRCAGPAGEFPLLRRRQGVTPALLFAKPGAEGACIFWRGEYHRVSVRSREGRISPDVFGPSFGFALLVVDFAPLAVDFVLGLVSRRLDKSAELPDGHFMSAKVERFADRLFLLRSFATNAGPG